MEFLFENETTDYKCYYYKINFNPQTNTHIFKISMHISKTQNKNNKVLLFNHTKLSWTILFEDNTKYNSLYFNKDEVVNNYMQKAYRILL